jgi:hypothetical protein
MCIIHKGFRGFRALSQASSLGGNLIPTRDELAYEYYLRGKEMLKKL